MSHNSGDDTTELDASQAARLNSLLGTTQGGWVEGDEVDYPEPMFGTSNVPAAGATPQGLHFITNADGILVDASGNLVKIPIDAQVSDAVYLTPSLFKEVIYILKDSTSVYIESHIEGSLWEQNIATISNSVVNDDYQSLATWVDDYTFDYAI